MIEPELERFRIWLHSQYLLRANDWEAKRALRKSIDPAYEPKIRYIACERADAFNWLISNSIAPRVIDQAIDNGWITEWECHDQQWKCANPHTQEWRMIPISVVLHFRLNESLSQTATEAVAMPSIEKQSDDVAEEVEAKLTGNGLELYRRLRKTKHFVDFDSLADLSCWRKKPPTDPTIVKALERLEADIEEFGFDLEIRKRERRVKLEILKTA